MTTPAKTAANRRNAQRSTGPRTPEGKEAARWNALRHGLTAEVTLLPDEDAEGYEALRTQLHAELEPIGAMESFLVDRIAAGAWRLRRMGRVEAEVFGHERGSSLAGEEVGVGLAFVRACNGGDIYSRLSRYEGELGRALHRTLHELERLQAKRLGKPGVH